MKGARNPRHQKYAKLRGLLRYLGIEYEEIADAYNVAHPGTHKYANWVSRMLCGREEIKMSVAYWLLDYLEIPHSMMHEYFPPNGEEEINE